LQQQASEKTALPKPVYLCGSGNINFDITSIKVALITADEHITNPSLSGKSTGVVTFTPNAADKTDVTNTQELDYTLWPVDFAVPDKYVAAVSEEDLKRAPLAKALADLRQGLIKGAQLPPLSPPSNGQPGGTSIPTMDKKIWAPVCFMDYNPSKPTDDSGYQFKLQMNFVNDTTYGFGISVWLISFSDTTENKSTTGNTLTVSFEQSETKNLQVLADALSKLCSGVDPDIDLKCLISTHAWHVARYPVDQQQVEAQAMDAELVTLCKPVKLKDDTPDPTPRQTVSADCLYMSSIARLGKKFLQNPGVGVNDVIGVK